MRRFLVGWVVFAAVWSGQGAEDSGALDSGTEEYAVGPGSVAPEPVIRVVRDQGSIRIEFFGRLESAANPAGPWEVVPGATSPWVPSPGQDGARLFRVQTDVGESLFSARSVVHLTVVGPLQAHFDLAYAGQPDGIFPPHREKPYFDGWLTLGTLTLPVELRVRGNSSLQECPFPKLKFKVSRSDREGTPFADAREVRIGTHCAEGGRGTVGRLREEKAALREVAAYEILSAAGFEAPRVRRARITYRDISTDSPGSETGWELRRSAMLLEDVEVLAERMGGRALTDEETAGLERAGFDEQALVDLRLFHALIGNWDFALSQKGRELWNTEVMELPDGGRIPIAGDFDLASWVTGEVLDTAPRDYRPDLKDVEREASFRIDQLRATTSAEAFTAGRDRFLEARSPIQARVETAWLDDEGRLNAVRHVDAFYAALQEESAVGGLWMDPTLRRAGRDHGCCEGEDSVDAERRPAIQTAR